MQCNEEQKRKRSEIGFLISILLILCVAISFDISGLNWFSFLEAKNLIELLLRDPYQLGNKNQRQIKTYSKRLISKLNPTIHKPLLKLTFDLTENLFNNFEPEKQKCIDIGLILIKELLLNDSTLINEIKCNELLNSTKITACNIFSEVEIWKLIDYNTQFKTFKYSSEFDEQIFSEIDFINKFNKINDNNLLDDELKNDFYEILNKNSIELVINSEIPTKLQFKKIIHDLKSYDWFIQNPVAKILNQIDLTRFDDDELKIIGRNLLQAADGRSWECQNTILSCLRLYKNKNIPQSLIKGIALEIFLNDDEKFRFKNNYSLQVIKEISTKKEFIEVYDYLINKIKNSIINNNDFYHYTTSIKELDYIIKEYEIEKINQLIKAIQISRCNSINKIINDNPIALLKIKSKKYIAPHINNCLNENNKKKFINLIYQDIVNFILLFSTFTRKIGTKEYTSLNVNFNLIEEFIDLKIIAQLVKNKTDEKNDLEIKSFCEMFFENLNDNTTAKNEKTT